MKIFILAAAFLISIQARASLSACIHAIDGERGKIKSCQQQVESCRRSCFTSGCSAERIAMRMNPEDSVARETFVARGAPVNLCAQQRASCEEACTSSHHECMASARDPAEDSCPALPGPDHNDHDRCRDWAHHHARSACSEPHNECINRCSDRGRGCMMGCYVTRVKCRQRDTSDLEYYCRREPLPKPKPEPVPVPVPMPETGTGAGTAQETDTNTPSGLSFGQGGTH